MKKWLVRILAIVALLFLAAFWQLFFSARPPVVCQSSAHDFREQIQQVEHMGGAPTSDDFGTPGPS